jgi:hypothetical protein
LGEAPSPGFRLGFYKFCQKSRQFSKIKIVMAMADSPVPSSKRQARRPPVRNFPLLRRSLINHAHTSAS